MSEHVALPMTIPPPIPTAGSKLRQRRQQLGLSIRDVHLASLKIASDLRNRHFVISISRLSEIETKGAVPGIHRLHSLRQIYRIEIEELLAWYGLP